MATQAQNIHKEKAIWDDKTTGIFLTILVQEIDLGNRTGTHFSKVGWVNIVKKFNETSGLEFTRAQLKNRLDNLKKDYTLWEKLRLNETGLGYDRVTNRITAESQWWTQKLLENPEYKRFRTQGPIHLDLQEMVFRGIIATGKHAFYPTSDPLLNRGAQIHDLAEDSFDEYCNEWGRNQGSGHNSDDEDTTTNQRKLTRKLSVRRVKCKKSSGPNSNADIISHTMMELVNPIKRDSGPSVEGGENETVMTVTQAVKVLRAFPWIQIPGPHFIKCLNLFEDVSKRLIFQQIMDLGEDVIKEWIDSQK